MKTKVVIFLIIIICSLQSTIFAENVNNSDFVVTTTNIIDEETIDTKDDVLDINAYSCILYDVDFSRILYEKNCNELLYPASTTKLLTAEIVLENCPDLSQMVDVSYYSVFSVPYSYSIAQLQPGERFSIYDLLCVMLIGSANDASYVLAQYVAANGNNYSIDSSSEAKKQFEENISTFSELMNNKAKELGCLNTNFVNPNGVHSSDHYSTAYDLCLIGAYCYNNETIRKIVSTITYSLNNSEIYNKSIRTSNNTNLLLYQNRSSYYEYANGLKTGYTDAAGSSIIASASKDNRNLVAVVLHSDSEEDTNARENDCKKLFEYGFNNYQGINLINKNDLVKELNIFNATNETRKLELICEDTITVLLQKGDVTDVTPDIKINKYFAPIEKNEVVGTASFNINGEEFVTNLIAGSDVESANYIIIVIVIVLIFVILLIIVIIWELIRKHRKNKKSIWN